jgi:transmembrane sensor
VGEQETAAKTADQAAEWAIRIDNGSVNPETDGNLQQWLEERPERRGALLRAEAALSFLDRGRALAGVIPKPARESLWARRRLLILGSALAAGLAGVAILMTGPQRYGTTLGEVKEVPLSDGSRITMNTLTTVEVAMHAKLREVTLTQGEAWFKVAHDSAKPFIVSAGRIEVRAVGTAFSVRRRDEGVEIQVTEGSIDTWTVGEESRRTHVVAGYKAYVSEYEPTTHSMPATDIERSLAWRTGQIVLDGETLDQAAARFNRYNARKLVIVDPALAREKLVGQFRATSPSTFADAVATTLGAKVEEQGDLIRISRANP